jgi:hypothetical protein
MKLEQCKYSGGQRCSLHGGSGTLMHKSGYVHPYPHSRELAKSSVKVSSGDSNTSSCLKSLESWFDDEVAERALMQSPEPSVSVGSLIKKSLYDFDVSSIEGIDKMLYLLSIVDEDVLKLVTQEIWPGYPVDEEFDSKKARIQIKGFLLDFVTFFEDRFTGTTIGTDEAGDSQETGLPADKEEAAADAGESAAVAEPT